MVDPRSEPQHLWTVEAAQSRSQASAFSGEPAAAAEPGRQNPPAQLMKLRHYVQQMRGMLLDTQA